jgi:K+/H+ antiporter YhaU regulatory subunit KhtT
VVLPAHIGADRIAHLILHPNARELIGGRTKAGVDLEHHLVELGLDMEEIEIGTESPWVHKRISEIETEAAGRMMPVAILRKEGGTDLNPAPTAMLMPGDALVVMKRAARRGQATPTAEVI